MRPLTIGTLLLSVAVTSFAAAGSLADPRAGQETRDSQAPGKGTSWKPRVAVTISKETTYVLGPLRADGYIDYAAALNQACRQGVTGEKNAAIVLWRALGPSPIPDGGRDRFFQELGMPRLPDKGDYFVPYKSFVRGRREPAASSRGDSRDDARIERELDQLARAQRAPWSKKECPLVAAWLEANERPLHLAVAATSRTRYYCPLVTPINLSFLLDTQLLLETPRDTTRALVARAMLRLDERKPHEAWDDLIACHRLARLLGQGPTLVDAVVAAAIDAKVCAGDQALLHYAQLPPRLVRKMREEYRRLSPTPSTRDKLPGERLLYLDAAFLAARDGLHRIRELMTDEASKDISLGGMLVLWAMDALVEWDAALRVVNIRLDAVEAALGKPTYAERWEALDEILDIDKLRKEWRDPRAIRHQFQDGDAVSKIAGRRIGLILTGVFFAPIPFVLRVEERAVTTSQLTDVAFALAAYRADNGHYPQRLLELLPKYLAQSPRDLFTDAVFRYKREGTGYLLYSLGPNGKDDGGKSRYDDVSPGQEPDPETDDIAVRVPPAGGGKSP